MKASGGGLRRTVALLSTAQAGKSPDSGLRLIRATVLMKAPRCGLRRTVALLSAAQAGKSPDSGLRLIRATVLMKASGGGFRRTVALLSAAQAGKSPDAAYALSGLPFPYFAYNKKAGAQRRLFIDRLRNQALVAGFCSADLLFSSIRRTGTISTHNTAAQISSAVEQRANRSGSISSWSAFT